MSVNNITEINHSGYIGKNTSLVNYNPFQAAEKINELDEKLTEKGDTFISECTDGEDDGKLSFGEKVKCFSKGFVDHFKEGFYAIKSLIKEHPKETLIAALLCITVGVLAMALVGAPVIVAGLSIIGISLGIKEILKDIKNIYQASKQAKNATSDSQAKQAYSNIGNNSADFVQNAVQVYVGCKGLSANIKTINAAKIAETSDEVACNAENIIQRSLNNKLSSDEIEVIKESVNHTGEIANSALPFLEKGNFLSNIIFNGIKKSQV